MRNKYSRRRMLLRTGQAIAAGAMGLPLLSTSQHADNSGAVVTNAAGATIGEKVLAEGGNAVDAAVATALAACIGSPHLCGIGGYGGHIMVARAGGKGVFCIDFNTAAAGAARSDMYALDEKGQVEGNANRYGWLASGVPGTLAGLQMALDKYGTRSFRELIQPAIQFARNGVTVESTCAKELHAAATRLAADPGSSKLYLTNGSPPKAGERLRNPDLAEMLSSLAERNSVDAFYRGDIAQHTADAFQQNGGIVTGRDLTAYRAREVKPLEWKHGGYTVYTAPLTAGGLTAVECLGILDALGWSERPASPAKTHALLEVMRLAWKDRLERLGDPEKVDVPTGWLLSPERARILADQADHAARSGKALDLKVGTSVGPGTTNISSVDRHGNIVAVTLTHGGAFGAQVTIRGLGVTLGQGMYKFNPHLAHPNSPGPGKRPLHNMCPTIILGPGGSSVAVGAAGGLFIPNALLAFLICQVFKKGSIADALFAPRLHTSGTLEVTADSTWPAADLDHLKQAGFTIRTGSIAHVSAVSFDPASGACSKGLR